MACGLDSGTCIIVSYILCYGVAHFWPLVISRYMFIRGFTTRVSCRRVIIVCFQDPEIEFKGIRDIYEVVDKEKLIFDLVFSKRHGFVVLITSLKGFEYFLY